MPNAVIVGAAASFISLARRHGEHWGTITIVSEEEIRDFFDTVVMAGFVPKEVRVGRIIRRGSGHWDYNREYVTNEFCPVKVVGRDGEDDHFATGWLDLLLRRVVQWQQNDQEGLLQFVAEKIEQSIPLPPIQLTPGDDPELLGECPPSSRVGDGNYFVQHTRDETELDDPVGVHLHCTGTIRRHGATRGRDVLHCHECGLRLYMPASVKTFGDLRRAFVPVPDGGLLDLPGRT